MYKFTTIEPIPPIQHGQLVIDPQRHTVTVEGEKILLYPKEFNVLLFLAQYPNWVLTPEQIYEAVWEEEPINSKTVVRNVICQLRKKLRQAPSGKEYIKTIVGTGYKLEIS